MDHHSRSNGSTEAQSEAVVMVVDGIQEEGSRSERIHDHYLPATPPSPLNHKVPLQAELYIYLLQLN